MAKSPAWWSRWRRSEPRSTPTPQPEASTSPSGRRWAQWLGSRGPALRDQRLWVFASYRSHTTIWGLDAHGAIYTRWRQSAIPESGLLISFDGPDIERAIHVGESAADARAELASDMDVSRVYDRQVRHARLSKEERDSVLLSELAGPWVYATAAERFEGWPVATSVVPGDALMRHVLMAHLRKHRISELDGPMVCGAFFDASPDATGLDADDQLLLLYTLLPGGDLGERQIIPLKRDAEFSTAASSVISSYIKEQQISASGQLAPERMAIFDAADLVAAVEHIGVYPKSRTVLGMTVDRLVDVAFKGASLALVAALGWWGLVAYQSWDLTNSKSRLSAQAEQRKQQMERELRGQRAASFLVAQGIDLDRDIDRAIGVYARGALVELDSMPDKTVITLTRPSGGREDRAFGDFNPIAFFDGCQLQGVQVDSNLMQQKASYECQSNTGDLVQRVRSGLR